jgi:hypothetical protein
MGFCTFIAAQKLNIVLENNKCKQGFSCVFLFGGECDLKLSVSTFVNNKKEVCGGYRFGF